MLQKLRLHTHKFKLTGLNGYIFEFNTEAIAEIRTACKFGTNVPDDLHIVELGLKNIIDRIDAIQATARDLHRPAQVSAEDTDGLERLEDALKKSLKKEVGDQW